MRIYHNNRINLREIGAKTPMSFDDKATFEVANLAQAVFVRINICKRTLF